MRGRSFAPARVACGFLLACVAPVSTLRAEDVETPSDADQIIVTASRLETTQADVGSSVSVVTQEELQEGKYPTVVEALRKVPGLDIVRSGGPGGNAAAFIRGADSSQTQVLLDGIELNNPASPNRGFNLTTLTLENVDRIEIIRGPQSMIYGSDAIGGVINIISKQAKKGVHMSAMSEAGSYSSFNNVGTLSYGSDAIDFTGGVTQQDVGNISSAGANYGNFEHDAFHNTSLSGRLALRPSDSVDTAFITRYGRSNAGLDNFGGFGGDDPNRHYNNEEFFNRGQIEARFLDNTLTTKAWTDYTDHGLYDNNDPDQMSAEYLRSNYIGNMLDAGTSVTWAPKKYFSSVLGYEYEKERASSYYYSDGSYGPYENVFDWRSANTNSVFFETKTSYEEKVFLDAGVRYDRQSIFGDRTTFRVAPAWYVTESTKLRGSVGTGFKAPSLVQLYSPYGNPDLQAETSTGWDIGVDQQIVRDRLAAEVTFFDNDYDDLITFNPSTFVLENINSAYTQGVEVALTTTLSETVSLRSAYTYTESEDRDTDESLLRRPRNKGSITTTYQPTDRVTSQVEWRVYGKRFDNDFSAYPPVRTTLAGYGLVNLAISYKANDTFEIFTRVDNIFDQEYEEVLGYGTMGCAAYGGVKASL
jgi:vitamin B12 transporter